MSFLNIACAVAFFPAAAYAAIEVGKGICRDVEPFLDGPDLGDPPITAIYICSAIVGVMLAVHHMPIWLLASTAVFNGCLVGSWYCDVRCGIVPDWFTLPPLSALLLYGVVSQHYWLLIMAVLLFIPFAVQAYISKGLGMGWGDTKLVAFGGALLGQKAFIATIAACVAVVIYGKIAKNMERPIVFGPFLVVAFQFFLAFFTPYGLYSKE